MDRGSVRSEENKERGRVKSVKLEELGETSETETERS